MAVIGAARVARLNFSMHPGSSQGVERLDGTHDVRPTLVRTPGAHPVEVAAGADSWLLDDASVDGEDTLYLDTSPGAVYAFKVTPTAPADLSFLGAGAALTLWADVRSSGDPARTGFRQAIGADVHLVAEQLASPSASAPVLDSSSVAVIAKDGQMPVVVTLGALKSPYVRLVLRLAGGVDFSDTTWLRADPLGGAVVPQGGLLAW